MEYKVFIPEEEYSVGEFVQDNLPGIAAVNISLCNFEPKVVFSWHLSILIQLEDLIENGMPSESEVMLIDDFEDKLDEILKGPSSKKVNALFFARITWNKTMELIWRVYDPEVANPELQKIIEHKAHPRLFDYRIDHDPEWKLTEWHLKNFC